MSDLVANDVVVKTEPDELLLETITPKEYLVTNGLPDDDNCEEIAFFTEADIECTQKCLENMRLIIKDFETQLDWHLQQYMILRKNNSKTNDSCKQDLVSISQLNALIGSHPEGNKKFIKRKATTKTVAKRKRQTKSLDLGDKTDDNCDLLGDTASQKNLNSVIKEEITEEEHELIEPKVEVVNEELEAPIAPTKRGEKIKNTKVTPNKNVKRRKTKSVSTLDTSIKNCKVILTRFDDTDVKQEQIDKDEIVELLKKKAVTTINNLQINNKKSTIVLNQDNFKYFDYKNCNTDNVFIKFENIDNLPEFIFEKHLSDKILTNTIYLVQNNVFSEFNK